jgi:hypothetical protein
MVAVIVIYGVSFVKLNGLQGPLASLNVAAHVIYRIARVRVAGNVVAFETDASAIPGHLVGLKAELDILRGEYNALLYGGCNPCQPGPGYGVCSRTTSAKRWVYCVCGKGAREGGGI